MIVSELDRTSWIATDATAEECLIDLMNRYEAPLTGYLAALLTDRDAVRDCLQDTFLRAFEHLRAGKRLNSQWLYLVARHRGIDYLRHHRKVRTDPQVLEALAVSDPDLSNQAVMSAAVNHLAPEDREILYLFVVEGFTTREIARMLGIRHGTLRVRLYRARERLRSLYTRGQE